MAVYTHCCRAQPLRQLGFLVYVKRHYNLLIFNNTNNNNNNKVKIHRESKRGQHTLVLIFIFFDSWCA